MSDHASSSLSAIIDGVKDGSYVLVPRVALFDEHDEFDAKGKLVRRFDKSRLQAIADRCNRRETETGDLAPVGPGHTIPGATVPETSQPPIWGYARNYQVERFGNSGKSVAVADFYVRAEHAQKVRQEFPRRSIELYPKDNLIDWIAVLRRSPQRDLGLLAYSKTAYDDGVKRWCPWEVAPEKIYADQGRKHAAAAVLTPDGKLRYAMDANAAGSDQYNRDQVGKFASSDHAANEMHGKDPGDIRNRLKKAGLKFHHDDVMEQLQKSGAMKPDAKDNWHIADHGKFHDTMHAAIHGKDRQTGKPVDDLRASSEPRKYSKENTVAEPNINVADPTVPPDVNIPADNGQMSPEDQAKADSFLRYLCSKFMNMAPPALPAQVPAVPVVPANIDKPGGDPPADEDDKLRMQKGSEATRYARMEQQLKALQADRDEQAKRYQKAECERIVTQLESEGYELDRAEEVQELLALAPDKRAGYVARVTKRYQRAPVGGSFIRTEETPAGDAYAAVGGREKHEKATRYMRENPGVQYSDALTKVA